MGAIADRISRYLWIVSFCGLALFIPFSIAGANVSIMLGFLACGVAVFSNSSARARYLQIKNDPLLLACALLVIIDILVPKHGPFAIEHWFGFYAFYGFIACVGLVIAAKGLRVILMKPEDYYDE